MLYSMILLLPRAIKVNIEIHDLHANQQTINDYKSNANEYPTSDFNESCINESVIFFVN